MTQGDLLPYPLAIRPCHVIYGQPLRPGSFFIPIKIVHSKEHNIKSYKSIQRKVSKLMVVAF